MTTIPEIESAARRFFILAHQFNLIEECAANSFTIHRGDAGIGVPWAITWTGSNGQTETMSYAHGCDLAGAMRPVDVYDRLRRAAGTLQVARDKTCVDERNS